MDDIKILDAIKEEEENNPYTSKCVTCNKQVIFESTEYSIYEEYEVDTETGDKYCFVCFISKFGDIL